MERIDRNNKMNIIILGSNHHNALGLIRSLGEVGHTVYLLLLKSGFNYVNKSSYLKSWNLIESYDEIILSVKRIVSECDTKPVMLVAGDEEATFVNQHFDELSEYCFVEGAYTNGDIAVYHDKFKSNDLAKRFGFKIPQTWMLCNNEGIPTDLRYPVLVKAGDSIRGGKGVLKKCSSESELIHVLEHFPNDVFPLQIQEYIQKEYEIIILGCSLNHGNIVLCPIAERKLRYYPQEYRTTAYTESIFIENDQSLMRIVQLISSMMKSIGYTGLFSVELLFANNQYYFLETNFRNDGTGYLATTCGFNLPNFLCEFFAGCQVDLDKCIYKPCHYVNVIEDFKNVVRGNISILKWIKQLSNAKCYSHYSNKDKLPLLYAFGGLLLSKIRKLK